jgi:hypothetical protein
MALIPLSFYVLFFPSPKNAIPFVPTSPRCDPTVSDVEDEAVINLNLALPQEPFIPPEQAWLKSEAGAIDSHT